MRIGYRKRTQSGDKTIHLPVPQGIEYDVWIENSVTYRLYLNEQIVRHPELFPPEIVDGYWLVGFVKSSRQQMKTRRIFLKSSLETYQIHPDTVMPYMVGKTLEMEKGLYLRGHGVSYEGIAYVMGHNAMYWYNATQALGRISIVGSTVKDPASFPVNLVADEKHSWLLGERVYIAVTAAMGCFLGVGLSLTASAEDLTQAYGEFAEEAREHCPEHLPQSVNVDGWEATGLAWKQLFPTIVIMQCFLHTVLGIQQRCRSHQSLFQDLSDSLWRVFHSLSPSHFGQRLRRLLEWVDRAPNVPQVIRDKLEKLKKNAANFKQTFQYPNAKRTSNGVDRLMNHQDRLLYAMQYFHGTTASARQGLRAMALIWNFHPYGQKVQSNAPYSRSPFEAVNGFQYADNWLQNLLIASSLNGRRLGIPVPLKTI